MRPNHDTLVLQINNSPIQEEEKHISWGKIYTWVFTKPTVIQYVDIDDNEV